MPTDYSWEHSRGRQLADMLAREQAREARLVADCEDCDCADPLAPVDLPDDCDCDCHARPAR